MGGEAGLRFSRELSPGVSAGGSIGGFGDVSAFNGAGPAESAEPADDAMSAGSILLKSIESGQGDSGSCSGLLGSDSVSKLSEKALHSSGSSCMLEVINSYQ